MAKFSLEKTKIAEIRSKVASILQEIGCNMPPVSVEKVAEHLGASLRFGPYSDGNMAGMLIRGEHSTIVVNSTHHKNRRRFTIAHECGHLLLHSDKLHVDKDFQVFKRNERSALAEDIVEIEANQFAAELLMPYSFLMTDIARTNFDIEDDQTVRLLATKYMTSVQAMTYRLANIFIYAN